MRTKQEVINFLESKLGTKVPCKGNNSLDGQCVTLIKALMEFLGMPDPYKARGHANTCVQAYLNEGIADKGIGFLSVFSNKNMGGGYGHVWCNAGEGNGVYYESNGAKSLICTKGKTYKYDNVCNFDRYIKDNPVEDTKPSTDGKDDMQTLEFLDCANFETAERKLIEHLGISGKKCAWGDASGDNTGGYLGSERRRVKALEAELADRKEYIERIEDNELENEKELQQLHNQVGTFEATIIEKNKKIDLLMSEVDKCEIAMMEYPRLQEENNHLGAENTKLQQELATLKSQCNIDYITALERKCSELESRSLWEMLIARLKELLG